MPLMADSPSSVSTASDDTDSILPTPQLYSGEMHSPEKHSPSGPRGMEKADIFSPVIAIDSPSPSFTNSGTSIPVQPPSIHRTFSTSKTSTRASAPPPILLRRPTDQPGQSSAKGLNINLHSASREEEEEKDGVPELIPSPRKQSWTSQLRNNEGAPMSPAWMSMEGSPGSSSGYRMPLGDTSKRKGSTGLFPPPSPLVGHSSATYQSADAGPSSISAGLLSPMLGGSPQPPRTNGRLFDPTPTHGIHARNMSLFFPQPGAGTGQTTNGLGIPMSPEPAGREQVIIPQSGKKPFGGQGEWSFGANAGGGKGVGSPEGVKSKRRGHHHKHSLSHNFFSFLDPTLTNPSLSSDNKSAPLLPPSTPKPADAPQPVPMPLHSSSLAHSPTLSPLPRASDPMSQLLASFSVLEFLIGAALWVEGQMGGWRCLAGVGYLVVFDAIGVGVGVVARGGEGWRSVRSPYGTTRFLSLLYFSQSLFLVFASVYIAKESIEQVVLGASGNEHGGHGHGHGHGGADLDGEERPFPTFLLLCATLASAVGGGIMHTHAKLVDAVGSLFLSPKYLSSPLVRRFPHLLANPFSVTVMGSSAVVLIGTMVVPLSSLHTFDALVALLLTVLTAALSLPPSKAFGQVLLQTAPPASTSQMKHLQRAIKEIKSDHRVRSITQTRCWAITAGSAPPPLPTPDFIDHSPQISPAISRQSSYSGPGTGAGAWHSPSSSPTVGEFGGIHPSQYPSLIKSDQDAPLVLTMELEVDEGIPDREVLDLTRVVWGKLGKVCKGTRGVGEVTVGIKRVKAE